MCKPLGKFDVFVMCVRMWRGSVCVCVYVFVCVFVCGCVGVWVCARGCVYVCVHIHTMNMCILQYCKQYAGKILEFQDSDEIH